MVRARLLSFAAVASLVAGGLPAFGAKAKKARSKPRVLIFDASDAKKRPSFEFEALSPDKVSAASIFFTTVSGEKPDGEPEDVSVEEKKLMLDQGKTTGAKAKP